MFSLNLIVTYFMKIWGFFQPQVIRGELIHRDHPEFSLRLPRPATGSVADRYTAAAARDQARIARRLAQGVEFSTPLSPGFPLYEQLEYAMTLYLGTPAQNFVLIVDTGSDLVWVQCKPCTSPNNCYPEADPFFDPSASSSYLPVSCNNTKICDSQQVLKLHVSLPLLTLSYK
jgi:hypothetical protein